ncbi:HNH/ENDO VII family nuclease [Paenibacillus sp. FSL H8-0034]|uniref:HNH/ENDO VII family nuclease n=1 Tax=Paenibacillus sp. FSL H8-0034 TaxID=2954671 RepID=UPI0030FAB9AA
MWFLLFNESSSQEDEYAQTKNEDPGGHHVLGALQSFASGAWNVGASAISNGIYHDTTNKGDSNLAYTAGEIAGGLAAAGIGVIETIEGITVASAGIVAIPETVGVAAVIIAPSLAVAALGVTTIGNGVSKIADGVHNFSSEGTGDGRLKPTKLSSEKIQLDWLPDKYTAVEVKGSVKVAGKDVDVSRRVYQIEIDKNYVPKDPAADGLTNKELMSKGKSPYVVKDGVESKFELQHLIQKESGGMVEIAESTHDKYSSQLHGLVEDGNSFRNDPLLEKQYNNFRSNYWKMRANEE